MPCARNRRRGSVLSVGRYRSRANRYFFEVGPVLFPACAEMNWEPKVPCATAIRAARAVVEEVPAVAASSVGRLARCTESHSERDVQRISTRFQLTLRVPLSEVKIGDELVSWIRMSDWAKFIPDHHLWYRLCGLKEHDADRCCKIWQRFWSRYRCINPGHEIFRRPHHDFSRTCGLMVHGNEGRSLRKAAMMVISAHSIFGFGLSTSSCKKRTNTKLRG